MCFGDEVRVVSLTKLLYHLSVPPTQSVAEAALDKIYLLATAPAATKAGAIRSTSVEAWAAIIVADVKVLTLA